MMPSEFNYTTGILIELGRMAVQDIDGLDYLAELEESALQSESLDNDLRADLDMILEGVKQAIILLGQADIIGLTRDEDAWSDAADAFDMLDLLVYLIEGVEYIIHRHENRIADDIHNKLNAAYEEASEIFFSPDFSTLRLATFNERRRDSLAGILPEYHYLFPWQLLQNDENCSILSILSEHFHELHTSDNLPEAIVQNLIFYIGEIQSDKTLSRFLQEENQISIMVKETLTKHWAFRLWRAAQSEGYKRILPKEVELKGIGLVSRAVLKQHGLSAQDRFALAVSAACYAPGIHDSDRVNLLFQCEEKLKTEWREYDAKTASGNLIQKLHLLESGQTSAREVAVSSIDIWFQQLNSAVTVSVKSEEPMFGLAGAMLSQEEVVSTAEVETNNDIPFFSTVTEWIDRLKNWFDIKPKFAYAMVASLTVIIIPLLFLLRSGTPLIVQINMMAEMHQGTLSRSEQTASVPVTVNKGVSLSTNDCIQLNFTASKDVYGYLLHLNSSGVIQKYYEGKLAAGQKYQFPDSETKACLTGKPGKETFFLITSDTLLIDFDEKISPIASTNRLIPHTDVLLSIKRLFPKAIIETFDYSFK